ncbi:MAG: tight adherence protein [Thermoleophilaceae bacterium]|nr:tight adherence protein [Thermoleophilaceae bacterium]
MISALLAFASAASAVAGTTALAGARPRRNRGGFTRRLTKAVPARLKPPLDLAARLDAAGSPGNLKPADFMAIKALTALGATPVGAAMATAAPGRLGALLTIIAPLAGFFAPDLHLRKRRNERIRATRRDLPGLLDLLRVAVDAGMAPSQALAAVAERSAAPLAAEWGMAAAQVRLGVPLTEALDTLTRRLPAPELEAFAAALRRATRHGAPLSDTLAAQARDARLARRRRIEEEAAKAAPKIQLVVALLLVPSVLLLVAAALAAALLGAHASLPAR